MIIFMSRINIENIIARNEEILAVDMDGEIVMMNLETGNYYNLGRTGSVIWNMIQYPITVDKLIQELFERYNVDRQQCVDEVLVYLSELSDEGLIVIR